MPLRTRTQKLTELTLAGLLALMVIIVFTNVVLRFAFNSGIPETEELSRYAFVWLTFLGAAALVRDDGHLGVGTVLGKLSPAGRKACRMLSDLVVIGCCVLFFIGSWHQTLTNVGMYSQAASFPMVLLYGVGMVSSLLMIINTLVKPRDGTGAAGAPESGISGHHVD